MKYGKIFMTVLAVAANSFAWTYEPSGGKFSADGSKVVFLSSSGPDGYDIYTANADGSGKVKLDVPAGLWGEPYLSPDGKKVAFITYDRFLNGNIFIADVDGKNLRQLTKYGDDPFEKRDPVEQRVGVLDYGLTFSPDGRTVLYISEELGTKDIFAINVDGTGKKRLTDFNGWEEEPVFLAGGEKILFTAEISRESGIWIMNADGSGKEKAPVPDYAELKAVSPDGKKIVAFGIYRAAGIGFSRLEEAAYVAALDGSSRFKIAERVAMMSVWHPSHTQISFSPDGKKVIYVIDTGIWIIDADGRGEKNLTPGWKFAHSPAFFQDGTKIALLGRPEGSDAGIWTMDVDGSNLKPFKATEGMDVYSFLVSPTGNRFLFQLTDGFEDSGRYVSADYFVVNADGTGLSRLTEGGVRFDARCPTDYGTFSADGSKVAYVSFYVRPGRVDGAIHTVNADGSGKVKFELPGNLWGEPIFSPDGKKIAFISTGWYFRNGNIFLVDVDGQNLKQLTKYGDGPAEIIDDADSRIGVLDRGLTFSPDGRKVLYCSEEFGSRDIFAVNADGTGKTRLTDFADCGESRPVFLAGGDKVLFEVTRDRVRNEIWIMNADGSGKKKAPVPDDTRLVAISPDGKKIIAFGHYPDDENGFDPFTRVPYVAALNGSSRFMLGEEDSWPSIGFPGSFSPDGKKVVYNNYEGIWIVGADGRGGKNLTPTCYRPSAPAFYADGAKIAFVGTRPWSPYCDDIWTMDADGSNLKLFKATESMDISNFVVSPSGDRFLIRGDYYGEVTPGYVVVNADGSGLVRLTAYDPPPYDEAEE
jgi:Tol biopolymer transport system component